MHTTHTHTHTTHNTHTPHTHTHTHTQPRIIQLKMLTVLRLGNPGLDQSDDLMGLENGEQTQEVFRK